VGGAVMLEVLSKEEEMRVDGTRRFVFVFLAVILVSLACSLGGGEEDDGLPVVEIVSPAESDVVIVGQSVTVVASISADGGIARAELLVNGQEIATEAPPSMPTAYNTNFEWIPLTEGAVVLAVIGYDQDGNASEPALVTVQVAGGQLSQSGPTNTQPAADETIMCTPPACGANEAYYCPGSCPGGCGITCATFTPTLPPPDTATFTPHPPTLTFTPTNTSDFTIPSIQIVVSLVVINLATVETVYEQFSVSAGNTGNTTATCPSGSVVVSGGYAASPDVLVYTQSLNGNGWQVYAKNNAGSSKTVSVYARCLKNTAGTITQYYSSDTVSPGDKKNVIQACPAGSIVTGGGFASYAAGYLQVYNSSKADSGSGWQVWAQNNSGSSRTVNVYALCLSGVNATTYDVLDSVNVPAGSTEGRYTNCGDDLAVGGGFATQSNLYMYNSSPRSATTNEWIGYAKNNGGSDQTFFNYAVCLTFD
jgi:hypothetical protein